MTGLSNIGVCLLGRGSMGTVELESDPTKGEVVRVSCCRDACASLSKILSIALECADFEPRPMAIPVDGPTLQTIGDYIARRNDDTSWEHAFVDGLSDNMLCNVANAANYLEMDSLLTVSVEALAKRLV